MSEDIYLNEIFDGIEESFKNNILNNSKEFIYMMQIEKTKDDNIYTGRVVKTKDSSIFKLNDKVFFHKSNAGSAKFNPNIVYTYYDSCHSSLNDFCEEQEITDVKLPLKYYIDKRIYLNEKKKKLNYVWIFALNRVEFYRDPKRMNGIPFGKDKALEKVSKDLNLDFKILRNHYNARCQCIRWAKNEFNSQ